MRRFTINVCVAVVVITTAQPIKAKGSTPYGPSLAMRA